MAEIEEELIIEINSETIRFITSPVADKITIQGVNLTDAQAATLAWLANKMIGTVLELQLKVKT